MDTLYHRKAWSTAVAAAAFTLLVAWMVPPTEPKQMGQDWRTKVGSVAPPAPVDFAGFSPASLMPRYPVERYAYLGEDSANVDVAVHRGSSAGEIATPVAYAPVASDPTSPVDQGGYVASPTSGYGHRWTEDATADVVALQEPDVATGEDLQQY